MKTLLAILTVLLLLPVGGEAKRGTRETVVVRDYTSAAWDGVVAQTVADFNAVLPKRGPRLRYERARGDCPAHPKPGGIQVCSHAEKDATAPDVMGVRIGRYIGLYDPHALGTERDRMAVCHEFMHVLTGIEDNYGALPDQSCVHGSLPEPGPFDVALLRQTYGRKHR